MHDSRRRAIAIGADIDIDEVKRLHTDCVWLAHIVDPALADGFLLDHQPDLAVVSHQTVDRVSLLEKRHPKVNIVRHPEDQHEIFETTKESSHKSAARDDSKTMSDTEDQQVVSVWSPKGGVGKSFVATNVAVTASLSTQAPVALFDLDLHSSDLGVYLDLLDGRGIVDALPHLPGMKPNDLDQHLLHHTQTGLWVLLGPNRPEMADFVAADQVARILELARHRFTYLFIDLPPHAGEDMVYECLEQSTIIVLVTTQDAATLRQTRLTLETMNKLCIDATKRVRVVLNRYHQQDNVPLQQVADFIGQPIIAAIADERATVERALFEGTPLVITRRSPSINSSFEQLAQHLCLGEPSDAKPRGGLWEDLRRRVIDGIIGAS